MPYTISLQEQERYDDYMEMREGMDLSNVHFKESLISWTSPDNPPWFAKISVFWLCNFLLLSWPLRLILELNTAHVHYQVGTQKNTTLSKAIHVHILEITCVEFSFPSINRMGEVLETRH